MANLGIDVGTDVKLAADSISYNGELAYRQAVNEVYGLAYDGRETVDAAGTAEPIVSSSTPARKVIIQALLGNTGVVVVGASTVVAAAGTRRGIALEAGDTITLAVTDLALIYIDAVVSGEGVSFVYFV